MERGRGSRRWLCGSGTRPGLAPYCAPPPHPTLPHYPAALLPGDDAIHYCTALQALPPTGVADYPGCSVPHKEEIQHTKSNGYEQRPLVLRVYREGTLRLS